MRINPPATPPITTPIDNPWELPDEKGGTLPVGVEVTEVEVGLVVEEGKGLLRHELSFVMPTVSIPELPPFCPAESLIMNTTDVPAVRVAVQSKLVGPTLGADTINASPKGIKPITSTG